MRARDKMNSYQDNQVLMIFTHLLLPRVIILAGNDQTGDNKTFEGICLTLPVKFRQKEL